MRFAPKTTLAIGALLVTATLAVSALLQRSPPAPSASRVDAKPSVGAIDIPQDEATLSTTLDVTGWALDPLGVRDVIIRFDKAEPLAAQFGVPRPDVAAAVPGYPQSRSAGFELHHQFRDLRPIRHPYTVVAASTAGSEHVLGSRSLIPPESFNIWRSAGASQTSPSPFYFLMATSGVAHGGANEIDVVYKHYASATQRIGMAVPILYLRTTKGRSGDWIFDSDFDVRRKCGERLLAEDSLNGVIRASIEKRLPVQFILNGGIWADAACDVPDWDLNDHLEEDVNNCQWSQDNQVFADDYLKNLAGSSSSPELARSLSYNVYLTHVRQYKKRNLQAAARRIAEFAKEHPDLFVGVNLDADTYINPFFEERQWFDYNPGTLRQFREWLRVAGPYAGKSEKGVPDLRRYRRDKPLSLKEVNRLARTDWRSWSEVEPPRRFPGSKHQPLSAGERLIWEDPWYWEWDTFRKHLVALHYAELAQWTLEAGIPRDKIFTAQGFAAPDGGAKPFAVRIASHGQNYDSGGVSIEGAIPHDGHLGAILYGPAAENRARMESRHGLFATFARMDANWAVVEMNSADLKHPQELPTYAQAYRAFRDLFNYDAKQVSLMAWNGSNGIYAGQPGYVSYTSWRNTPAEEAMRDHLVSHANLPHGARLWTFGSATHQDDDGWTVIGGQAKPGHSELILSPNAGATAVELVSPPDQVIRRTSAGTVVLGLRDGFRGSVSILGQRDTTSSWRPLGMNLSTQSPLQRISAGLEMPVQWPSDWPNDTVIERLKIVLSVVSPDEIHVERIAVVPGAVRD